MPWQTHKQWIVILPTVTEQVKGTTDARNIERGIDHEATHQNSLPT